MKIFLELYRRSTVRVAALWVASVVLFSLVYWGYWNVRPDSFILNKEFNLTPYDQLLSRLWQPNQNAMWGESPGSKAGIAADLEEFMNSVNELDMEATSVLKQLQILQEQQKTLEDRQSAVYQQHDTKLWANVEKYKSDATRKEEEAAQRAREQVSRLESIAGSSPSSSISLVIANAKVKLAYANYAVAVRRAEAADYVIHNLRALGDSATTAELDTLRSRLSETSKEQLDLTFRLGTIRERAFAKLRDWYSIRTSRLDWIDFLYFSAGVSTTTTFGDIVPNSRAVRVIVITQLVVSVLIVGYFVSLLSSSNGEMSALTRQRSGRR